MSTTATQLSAKTLLQNVITRTSGMIIQDLAFIPEDKLNVSPMGCARTPLHFTAECAGFNMYVGKLLAGEVAERPSPEVREQFYASIDTLEKATEAIRSSADKILAGLENADDEMLMKEIQAPWGATVPVYQLVQTAGVHMGYHDGQINYIQSLYGDGENHWS
jgi:hypothetical protein